MSFRAPAGRPRGSWLWLLAAAFVLFSVHDARAGPGCTVSATNLVFGDVTSAVLANAVSATTGTISYTCTGFTKNVAFTVCIALDHYNAGNTRSMTSGANTLNYQIYQDAAHTQVWGDSADGNIETIVPTADNSGDASGSATMYAEVLTGQTTVKPASYSQSITGDGNDRLTDKQGTGTACTAIGGNAQNIAFTSTATISASCNVSAAALNFGSMLNLASNTNSTTTITVQCTNTTPYNVGLNAGTATGATVTTRKMTSGASTVSYALYSNSGMTTNWGNTVGTDTVSGTGTGANQNYTVYGQIPTQTTPAPATYNDAIIVTVTY